MQWDADIFEHEVREYPYFQDRGFAFAGRKVNKPGTEFERYEVTLRNATTDRSLEITFSPPRGDGRPAVSLLNVIRTSTDEFFSAKHYIKQHHGIDIGAEGSRYTTYSGTFEERVRAYLDFVTGLLAKHLEPTLEGREWPQVDFDWGGHK